MYSVCLRSFSRIYWENTRPYDDSVVIYSYERAFLAELRSKAKPCNSAVRASCHAASGSAAEQARQSSCALPKKRGSERPL